RSVRVEYLFRCDTLVTSLQEQQNSKDGLDRDGNGTISAQEFADRKSEYLSEFARVSNLRVDGKAIELHGSLAASSIFDIRGEGDITGARAVGNWLVGYLFVLSSDVPIEEFNPGKHVVSFSAEDARLTAMATRIDYEVKTLLPNGQLRPRMDWQMRPQRFAGGMVQALFVEVDIPEAKEDPANEGKSAPDIDTAEAISQRKEAIIEREQERFASGDVSEDARQESELRRLLDEIAGGGLAMWLAFLAIFGLGAWHALQPGHGKTLVASYLISTHGRPRDALTLGVTVTMAHVSGVFLMLGIWLGIEAAFPDWRGERQVMASGIIALGVGVTIFAMGVGLLFKRLGRDPGHHHDIFGRHVGGHDHDHGHHHHHDHDHGHDHHHDHDHDHHHHHDHDHGHHHHHDHDHGHDHHHDHDHG
ncbi:MAG: hypothetical protein KDB07_00655, partial [Planctomycetes bacterium]|nr:hypothetical protein [Planctomycetota bacterium]